MSLLPALPGMRCLPSFHHVVSAAHARILHRYHVATHLHPDTLSSPQCMSLLKAATPAVGGDCGCEWEFNACHPSLQSRAAVAGRNTEVPCLSDVLCCWWRRSQVVVAYKGVCPKEGTEWMPLLTATKPATVRVREVRTNHMLLWRDGCSRAIGKERWWWWWVEAASNDLSGLTAASLPLPPST